MNINNKGNDIMDIQVNNHTNLSSAYNKKPVSFNSPFDNNGLAELRSHICHLEELNERLKYMMSEIRFLITNTL